MSTASSPSERRTLPPALLTDATWYGTLAAARDLGSRGVPVTLACDAYLAPARWSRHVARTIPCPPAREARRFVEWLHAFAARNPGHVYHPTSDDTEWLVAANRDALDGGLRTFLPPLASLVRLLDKVRLGQAAGAAGVATPRTWCPADEAEVARLARELPYPVLLKPRMQIFSDGWKGVRVTEAADLLPAWKARRNAAAVSSEVTRHVPDAALPIVQELHASSERIYTLDGFVGAEDDAFVALGCNKLVQLPRGGGPGVAFEAAAVEPAAAAGLRRLFREVGFVGVFDAEFLVGDGPPLLIDVNPRFYNHMAFEVERGLPLPWLAYLAARGEDEALAAALGAARAAAAADDGERVYAHRQNLGLLLRAQRLAGAMSADEVRAWHGWLEAHRGRIVDPASSGKDPRPALVDRLYVARTLLRHPRAALRGLMRPGAPGAPSCAPVGFAT